MRGRLRRRVTAVAMAAISVPLLAIASLVAVYLRDEAMRLENAPGRGAGVCAVVMVTQPEAVAEDRWQWRTTQCDGAGYEHRSLPVRVGDVPMTGIAAEDVVVAAKALRSSHYLVPELSLWPLTDPVRIGHRRITEDGSPISTVGARPEELEQVAAVQQRLNQEVLLLFGGALALTALTGIAVWLAVGRALRPVGAIRRELADITEHDLARRVPLPRVRNELSELAATVNTALDRLERAVEENRRFAADASHELRSPIAALRAELEIARSHPENADWPSVVEGALADTDRIQALTTDLLLLTRLDHTKSISAPLDLVALAREDVARRRSGHELVVDLPDAPVQVLGSRPLLGRLLGNLLDNAERHAESAITVRLSTTDDSVVLEVADDGQGIPEADRERVFDRFTRLDEARARDTGGTGLGLAIARRIAAVHRGTLVVGASARGALLIAALPRADRL
ncbi:sensor histidine kinase [Actinosynnema mirum]|uniref:histidine kinase n=1 Tax=Actinosynnema mirum (strain ATCC 29888 / DSM 43827 / JCM 3225 / NBRC 14064 / NCIMB 13271 / NRRL B-12336 / IMRU 3971 / 101) TaxID=446462 RepID=C6WA98_ACTMD|nr:HAMP domain-containing sensor histidine kinase [Actinosynnema mirum]ACU39287.1 histidine kinase [Actinosynnema mirum DSM 43827]